MRIILSIVLTLLMVGCGFKSDLSLPEREGSLPEVNEPDPPLLPSPTAGDEPNTPGVAVEIPPLDDEQSNDKKKP